MSSLLAEDNITNQQVAPGILKRLGLYAEAVANGAEALTALQTIPYDLVLMDVQMPVLDGLEATRQIRDPQSPIPRRGIPIIAMTAHAMQGDRERCVEAGRPPGICVAGSEADDPEMTLKSRRISATLTACGRS